MSISVDVLGGNCDGTCETDLGDERGEIFEFDIELVISKRGDGEDAAIVDEFIEIAVELTLLDSFIASGDFSDEDILCPNSNCNHFSDFVTMSGLDRGTFKRILISNLPPVSFRGFEASTS